MFFLVVLRLITQLLELSSGENGLYHHPEYQSDFPLSNSRRNAHMRYGTSDFH